MEETKLEVVVTEEDLKNDTKIKCDECGFEAKIGNWAVIDIPKDDGFIYTYTVCPYCGLHYLGIVKDDFLIKNIERARKLNLAIVAMIEQEAPTSQINKLLKEQAKLKKYNDKYARKLKQGKELTYRSSINKSDNQTVESEKRGKVNDEKLN